MRVCVCVSNYQANIKHRRRSQQINKTEPGSLCRNLSADEDLRSNGLHDRYAGQVNVIIFCVTAVVPERNQLIAVGKHHRSGARKYQSCEFVALGPGERKVAPKKATAASFILLAICGGSAERGRLISLRALVEYRGPVVFIDVSSNCKTREHTRR